MTLASMTGFGRSEGSEAGAAWAWELRSVNGRGLELRLRLPPGLDAMEPALRDEAARSLRRGNINGTLTVRREETPKVTLDRELLMQLLRTADELREWIPDAPPPRPEALLALPGVLRNAAPEAAPSPALVGQIKAGFSQALAKLARAREEEGFSDRLDLCSFLLAKLARAREEEGARLAALIGGQLDAIGGLRDQAIAHAADQPERQRARMLQSLLTLLRDAPGLPQERIAQEVSLLATRSDVQEELDRLSAHLAAARALLAERAGVGRRFDFLTQEFVRETNTLCSKSATVELTATGLQLKAVIEQMREQVQNVE